MSKPKVSVILVNFRGADDTLTAIESVWKCDWDSTNLEIIVVDNNSGDDSLSKLSTLKNKIKLIASEKNLGFAGGVNLGVKEASGEIIALLNNDARVDKNWISTAVEKLASEESIAAIACKVLSWDGSRIDFVDGGMTWYGMGYKKEVEMLANRAPDLERDVLFATGSGMFVKKDIFNKVRGFDENFFMFYEDVDLGWRLNLFGYKIKHLPTSIVYHKHHASIKKFNKYYENFLLERNALISIFKNYEKVSLEKVLPAAMALSVRRSLSRGGLDTKIMNLNEYVSGQGEDIKIKKEALTGTLAIESFISLLPKIQSDREFIQENRKKSDLELLALFRNAMEPAYSEKNYLDGYKKIVEAFEIGDFFEVEEIFKQFNDEFDPQENKSKNKNVLIITGDPLGENMAGPAIRALEMARVISRDFECILASTNSNKLKDPDVRSASAKSFNLRKLARWADIIIFQGYLLADNPWLVNSNKILIADLYDPFHLEVLEQQKTLPIQARLRESFNAIDALNEQLRRSDFFLCASERQKSFWLGQLAAEGRVNPFNYDLTSDLSKLIDVVPFGVASQRPGSQANPIRSRFKNIKDTDTIAIWSGGLYDWLDPMVIVKALAKLNKPELKLVFMGLNHPNKDVPRMKIVEQLIALSDSLELTNKNVFFINEWVGYRERGEFLSEADFGVSAHLNHIETKFSFRTRILDHFWAGLPTITTKGDALAEIVDNNSAGIAVDFSDVDGWAKALDELLTNKELRTTYSKNASALAGELSWDKAVAPLVDFIRSASPAADREFMSDLNKKFAARNYFNKSPNRFKSKLQKIIYLFRDYGFRGKFFRILREKILKNFN